MHTLYRIACLLFLVVSTGCQYEVGFDITVVPKKELNEECLKSALENKFPEATVAFSKTEGFHYYRLIFSDKRFPYWLKLGLIKSLSPSNLRIGFHYNPIPYGELQQDEQEKLKKSLTPVISMLEALPEVIQSTCKTNFDVSNTRKKCTGPLCEKS